MCDQLYLSLKNPKMLHLKSCVYRTVCSFNCQINKATSVQKLDSLAYQWLKFGLIAQLKNKLNKSFWIFHAFIVNMVQLLPESEIAHWKIFCVGWRSENFHKQKCESLTVYLFPVCKIGFFSIYQLLNKSCQKNI